MELTLNDLSSILSNAADMLMTINKDMDEDSVWDTPLVINRYNTKMNLDRIVIYTNGKPVELVFTDCK